MPKEEKFTEIPELVEEVKKFINETYEPVSHPLEATVHFTTLEIYRKLQLTFPGYYYKPVDISLWLMEAGFKIANFGEFKPEWLFKERQLKIFDVSGDFDLTIE